MGNALLITVDSLNWHTKRFKNISNQFFCVHYLLLVIAHCFDVSHMTDEYAHVLRQQLHLHASLWTWAIYDSRCMCRLFAFAAQSEHIEKIIFRYEQRIYSYTYEWKMNIHDWIEFSELSSDNERCGWSLSPCLSLSQYVPRLHFDMQSVIWIAATITKITTTTTTWLSTQPYVFLRISVYCRLSTSVSVHYRYIKSVFYGVRGTETEMTTSRQKESKETKEIKQSITNLYYIIFKIYEWQEWNVSLSHSAMLMKNHRGQQFRLYRCAMYIDI